MVTKNHPTPKVFRFEDESSRRYWYVRLTGSPEAPEWVCADIVAILFPEAKPSEYSNYYAQVPPEWKSQQKILAANGEEMLPTIYESGLYYLMVQSNSPMVIPLQQWISQEVLPVIRPKGNYSTIAGVSPTQEPSTKEKLETIRLAMDMLYELGGIDERMRLALREQIGEILLEEKRQKSIRFSTDKAKLSSSKEARPVDPFEIMKTSEIDGNKSDNRTTMMSSANSKEEAWSVE
jgi:prophage antirepressor-like protein